MFVKKRVHLSSVELISTLWPYLLLIGFMIPLFFLGLYVNYQFVSKNASALIEEQFKTMSDDVYLNITRPERVCELLATDSTVLELGKLDAVDPDLIDEYSSFLKRQLDNIQYVSSEQYNNLMIVFPQIDVAVTSNKVGIGAGETNQILTHAFGNAVTLEKLKQIPTYNSRKSFYGDQYIIVRSINKQNRAIAYVLLSMEFDRIVPLRGMDGLVFIGDNEEYTYTNDQTIDQAAYQTIRNQVESSRTFEFDNRRYLAHIFVFSQLQRDIIVAIHEDATAFGFADFHKTAGWLSFVFVLCLAVIFYVMYRKILEPLAYLAEATVHREDRHILENARSSLVKLKEQNEAGRKEIRFLIPLGIGELIQRLCSPKLDNDGMEIAKRCMSLAGIDESQRFCIFGVFHLEDVTNTFREMEWKNSKVTPLFVLNNLLTDLLYTKGVFGTIAVVDQYYIVLTTCRVEQDAAYFNDILQKIVEFYQNNYDVTIATTDPEFGSSIRDFAVQVRKTMNRLYYLDFWHKDRVQEECDTNEGILSYLKTMRNLIGKLDEKDFSGALAVFQTMMADLPLDPAMLQIAKYRCYGMVEVLLAALIGQSGVNEDVFSHLDYESRLYGINNVKDFRRETEAIFAQIMEISNMNAQKLSKSKRMEQVQQYILEHYTERDLTVGTIADKFDISVAYLSREYKKSMHINLTDQLQMLRVEKAKELLAVRSVKDTAILSGFWDYQALVRTFKKLEGITPNEYKKMISCKDFPEDDPAKS